MRHKQIKKCVFFTHYFHIINGNIAGFCSRRRRIIWKFAERTDSRNKGLWRRLGISRQSSVPAKLVWEIEADRLGYNDEYISDLCAQSR